MTATARKPSISGRNGTFMRRLDCPSSAPRFSKIFFFLPIESMTAISALTYFSQSPALLSPWNTPGNQRRPALPIDQTPYGENAGNRASYENQTAMVNRGQLRQRKVLEWHATVAGSPLQQDRQRGHSPIY